MNKYSKTVLAVIYSLLVIIYGTPFFLQGIAKKHIMFFRYLTVKQYWWEDEMRFLSFVLTIAFVAIAICLLVALKRGKQSYLNPFYAINIISLIISAIAMNITPKLFLAHFMLLIASWLAIVLTTTAMLIIKFKGKRL